MKRIVVLAVLLAGCQDPIVVEQEAEEQLVRDPQTEVVELVQTIDLEPAPESDAEIETITASEAIPTPFPHESPRYTARCREEARRDTPVAISIEVREDARTRARALAREGSLNTVVIFARMLYGETGPPIPGENDDEAEAILAVMDSLRGRMSRVEMFVTYSPRRIFPQLDDQRQQWLAETQLDGTRPVSWPRPRYARHHEYAAWINYGCPRWLATVDWSRRTLRANPGNIGQGPCSEIPDHWGGDIDDPNTGWKYISCGTVRNGYYVVPARAARREIRVALLSSSFDAM